jgi:hypothetical protein
LIVCYTWRVLTRIANQTTFDERLARDGRDEIAQEAFDRAEPVGFHVAVVPVAWTLMETNVQDRDPGEPEEGA